MFSFFIALNVIERALIIIVLCNECSCLISNYLFLLLEFSTVLPLPSPASSSSFNCFPHGYLCFVLFVTFQTNSVKMASLKAVVHRLSRFRLMENIIRRCVLVLLLTFLNSFYFVFFFLGYNVVVDNSHNRGACFLIMMIVFNEPYFGEGRIGKW